MDIEKIIKIYSVVLCFVLLLSVPAYAGNKADEAYEAYASEHGLKLVNKVEYTNQRGDLIVAYGAVPGSLYDDNLFYFDMFRTTTDPYERASYIFAGLTSESFNYTIVSFYSVSGVNVDTTVYTASNFNNFYYYCSTYGTYAYQNRVDDNSGLPVSTASEQLEKALAFFQQPPPAPPEETEEPEEMGEIIWGILLPILKIGVLLAIFLLLCLLLLTLLKAIFQKILDF